MQFSWFIIRLLLIAFMSRYFPLSSRLASLHVFLVHAVLFQCDNNSLNFAMDIFTRVCDIFACV